jgi:hypothetical protein
VRLQSLHSPVNAIWRLTAKLKATASCLALAVQVASLLGLWIVSQCILGLSRYLDLQLLPNNMGYFVVAQGIMASALAHKFKMARWWIGIHFAFPVLLYAMTYIELNDSIYLAGFIISLTLYWTTFKTQVPFYPSRPVVWRAVDQVIHQQFKNTHQPINIAEIGSGLGDFSMYLVKRNHLYQVMGIEIAPLPWLISKLRAIVTKSSVNFVIGDYQHLNFASQDVIFAYLSPAAMPALWQKASLEMRPGSLLISLEFDIPNTTPTHTIYPSYTSPCLYVWRIN